MSCYVWCPKPAGDCHVVITAVTQQLPVPWQSGTESPSSTPSLLKSTEAPGPAQFFLSISCVHTPFHAVIFCSQMLPKSYYFMCVSPFFRSFQRHPVPIRIKCGRLRAARMAPTRCIICLQNAPFCTCPLLPRALLFLLCCLLFPLPHHRLVTVLMTVAGALSSSWPPPASQSFGCPASFPLPGLSLSPSRDPPCVSHRRGQGYSNTHRHYLCAQEVPERQLSWGTECGLERGELAVHAIPAARISVTTWSRIKALPLSSPFLKSAKMKRFGSKVMVTTLAFWDIKLSGKRTPEVT